MGAENILKPSLGSQTQQAVREDLWSQSVGPGTHGHDGAIPERPRSSVRANYCGHFSLPTARMALRTGIKISALKP